MNLVTLQSQLYNELNLGAAPNSDVVARMLGYINESYRELLGMKGLDKLRRNILTFSSVANSPFAVLPQASVQVISVMDRTNNWVLAEVSLQDLRFSDPGLVATSGYPYEYAVLDLAAAVAQDPPAASTLSVVSTNASDNSSARIYVEGIITGGYYQVASSTLNGITPQTVASSITNWIRITKVYLGAAAGALAFPANGTVTLSDGSANVLAVIPPGASYARYTRLHLHPTPTQVNTYYADIVLHVEDLSHPGDEPFLPEDFHYLLKVGAKWKEYTKKEKAQQASEQQARWVRGVSDMKLFVRRKSGVAFSDRRRRRFSALGPYYESGT